MERLQKKTEDLLKENEKLKSDRGLLRKQYMYGQTSGVQGGVMAGGKFNSSLFGQHLLSKATGGQKENTVGSSQLFAAGFSKFIGDGADNNKVDP